MKGRTVAAVTIGKGKRKHILKYHSSTYCGLDKNMSDKTQEASLRGHTMCINCRVSFYKESK